MLNDAERHLASTDGVLCSHLAARGQLMAQINPAERPACAALSGGKGLSVVAARACARGRG